MPYNDSGAYNTPIFPKRIEIELASDCNLRCTYCPRHFMDGLSGYMEFSLFEKIIREAAAYPETILVLHRRGESMLHPRFNEIMDLVSGKFAEVQMATNGTLMNKDKFESIVRGLDFLSFSLDAPSTYNQVRVGADYEKVKGKILSFLEYNGGRVRTQVSMVRTSETKADDCEVFKTYWRDKVDRVRIYEEHSSDGKFGSLKNPRKTRRPCVMPFYELLVYEDGSVARCNHDWDGESMGDLNVKSINEIWHSPLFENLRKQHLELKFEGGVCASCDSWYGEIGIQGTGEVIEK